MSNFGRILLSSFALCRASTGSRSPPPRLCLAPSPPTMRTRAIARPGLRQASPYLAGRRPGLAPARRTGFVGTASDRSGLRRKPALARGSSVGALRVRLEHIWSTFGVRLSSRRRGDCSSRAIALDTVTKSRKNFRILPWLTSFGPLSVQTVRNREVLRYIVPKSPALTRRYRLFEQSQARLHSFRYYMAIFS